MRHNCLPVGNWPSGSSIATVLWLQLAIALVIRVAVAPLRQLSGDEAYYLCAARHPGWLWTIPDHPPFLGVLISVADSFVPGPVELRVRSVAIVLQLVTAVGLSRLARRLAMVDQNPVRSPAADLAACMAGVFGTWGLLPMAGGLITTPDAPLIASLTWICVILAAPGRPLDLGQGILLALLAAIAFASKVSAAAMLIPLALGMFGSRPTGARDEQRSSREAKVAQQSLAKTRSRPTGARGDREARQSLAKTRPMGSDIAARLPGHQGRPRFYLQAMVLPLGCVSVAPLALPSLRFQLAHALGFGSATAPFLGSLGALGALVSGQVLLWSPPLVFIAIRTRRILDRIEGMQMAVVMLAVAVTASALISGRPPEPNWLAPIGIPLVACVAVAWTTIKHRWLVVTIALLPTLAALFLWVVPLSESGPLGRVPRTSRAARVSAPQPLEGAPYAASALACVYENACEQIEAILNR